MSESAPRHCLRRAGALQTAPCQQLCRALSSSARRHKQGQGRGGTPNPSFCANRKAAVRCVTGALSGARLLRGEASGHSNSWKRPTTQGSPDIEHSTLGWAAQRGTGCTPARQRWGGPGWPAHAAACPAQPAALGTCKLSLQWWLAPFVVLVASPCWPVRAAAASHATGHGMSLRLRAPCAAMLSEQIL